MASAKHPLSLHGAPIVRRTADASADRDHGRLTPALVVVAALLALATSSDRGADRPRAMPSPWAAIAGSTRGSDLAVLTDAGLRAALADALSGAR